jgi:hypothetical protein
VVQRQHQLGAQPFPQRILTDPLRQFGYQQRVPPEGDVRIDAGLESDQAVFIESCSFRAEAVHHVEVAKGWTAPLCESLA